MRKLLSLAYKVLTPLYFNGMYLAKVERPPLRPLMLNLEITTRCNLRCKMCLQSALNLPKMDMTLDTFRTVLDKIPSPRYVNLIGTGEPLLHKDFYTFLDILAERRKLTCFTTNGVLFKADVVEKLKKYSNIAALYCSIDSPDPAEFQEMRGTKLDPIVEHLQAFTRAVPTIPLTVQMIMNRRNLHRLSEAVDFAQRVGARVLSLLQLLPYTPEEGEQHAMLCPDLDKNLDAAIQRGAELGIKVVPRPRAPRASICSEPFWHPTITLTGDVLPCCFMNRANVESTDEWFGGCRVHVPAANYVMGNVLQDDFDKIWQGEKYRSVRRTLVHSTGTPPDLDPQAFAEARKTVDTGKGHSYCRFCLYRYGSAC